MPSKRGSWHDSKPPQSFDVEPSKKKLRRTERHARMRREAAESLDSLELKLAMALDPPLLAIPKSSRKPKFVAIPERTFDMDENSPKATASFVAAFKRMHEMFCMGAPSLHTVAQCPKCDKTIKGVRYMDGPWRWTSMQRHLVIAHKRRPDPSFVEYVEERYASASE